MADWDNFKNSLEKKLPSFCTKDNMQAVVSSLNQDLQVLGFSVIDIHTKDVVLLVNHLHGVLRLYQTSVRDREQTIDRMLKMKDERGYFESSVRRLREELEEQKQNFGREQETNRQLSLQLIAANQKYKKEKDEVKKLRSSLSRETHQSNHRIKILERQVIKLTSRLHDIMDNKTPCSKMGLNIANNLHSGGRRAVWQTGQSKQEELLHQRVIAHYEEQNQALTGEILKLQGCLGTLEKELQNVLEPGASHLFESSKKNFPRDVSYSSDDDADASSSLMSSSQTTAPQSQSKIGPTTLVETSPSDIEKRIKNTCTLLKKKILQQNTVPEETTKSKVKNIEKPPKKPDHRLSSHMVPESGQPTAYMDKLYHQLMQYRQIIQHQDVLLQKAIQAQYNEAGLKQDSQEDQIQEIVDRYKRVQIRQDSSDSASASPQKNASPFGIRMLPATPVLSHNVKRRKQSTAELQKKLGVSADDVAPHS